MGDIEDLGSGLDLPPRSQSVSRSVVLSRRHNGRRRERRQGDQSTDSIPSSLPNKRRVWVKTYGCSHNVSDSEYMEGLLAAYGYGFASTKDDADVWLINSCTVKDPSQSAFTHLVQTARKEERPLVVAGCVPQGDRNLKPLSGVSVIGVQQIDRVVEVVEETLKGNVVRLLGKSKLPRLDLPKVRRNPLVEIVPINTGCLGNCTYCKTKHARGKLGSYDLSALVGRVREVVREGVVTEIWLTSEDTGAYGLDLGTNIANLLRALVAELPSDRRVMMRVGMTNPPYILEHLEAVAEALNHPCVFSFLHVPVQSGSDAVLSGMNREYTVSEFRRVADYLLARVPGLTLATDIICGFPGETEEQFEETLSLIRDYRFPVLNISQFYPRPGTPAAKMKRIDTKIVKDRSRRCTKLFLSYQPHAWLLENEVEGKVEEKHGAATDAAAADAAAVVSLQAQPSSAATIPVFVCTEKSSDGRHSVGHTKGYVKVLLPRDDSLIGCEVLARVTSAHKFHVTADVVSVTRRPRFDLAAVLKGTERDRINRTGADEEKVESNFQSAAAAPAPATPAGGRTSTGTATEDTCSNQNGCCGGKSCSTKKGKAKTKAKNEMNASPVKQRSWDKSKERWIFLVLPIFTLVLVPLLKFGCERM